MTGNAMTQLTPTPKPERTLTPTSWWIIIGLAATWATSYIPPEPPRPKPLHTICIVWSADDLAAALDMGGACDEVRIRAQAGDLPTCVNCSASPR